MTTFEATTIYEAGLDEDHLEFCSDEPIPPRDYRRLYEYIESRPAGSVCLRASNLETVRILSLPITKSIWMLNYLSDLNNPGSDVLIAVSRYDPIEDMIHLAWTRGSLPPDFIIIAWPVSN